jgi:hypothetical protein
MFLISLFLKDAKKMPIGEGWMEKPQEAVDRGLLSSKK